MSHAGPPVRLEADWLLPVDRPPIQNGAILVGADGRIAALGSSDHVPTPPGIRVERFSGAALLPGLVNAHTHLELTGLGGRVEHDDFSHWVRAVRDLKAGLTPEWFAEAARQGVRDAFAAGITTVLDTGDSGAVLPALVELGGAGVVYQEVFGPHPDQLAASLTGLEARLAQLRSQVTARVRLGVSPHAPYTVSGPLYRAVAELARRINLPIAVHLAESLAETQFVTRDEGPFAAAWRARGIPPLGDQLPEAGAGARRSPMSWVDAHGVLGPSTTAIHAIQLDDVDLDLLATRGVGVALCPLSNARHGHGQTPLAALRARGIPVGVGTDSVVSVGTLDLFAEMRAARALGGLTVDEALALGTIEAARLVGLENEVGRLAPGAWGDVVVLEIPPGDSPVESVLGQTPSQVLVTLAAGREVYRHQSLA